MRRRSWCWLLGVLLLAAACSASPSEETPGSGESPRDVVTTPTSQPPTQPEAVHRMRGTDGDDRIVGTSGRDAINSRRGADVIRGGAGDDVLRDYSGVGTGRPLDTSRDVFYGGPGDDLIYASQHDRVSGGAGDDTIYADYVDRGQVIACGPGRDVVILNDDDPGLALTGCETVRVQYAG